MRVSKRYRIAKRYRINKRRTPLVPVVPLYDEKLMRWITEGDIIDNDVDDTLTVLLNDKQRRFDILRVAIAQSKAERLPQLFHSLTQVESLLNQTIYSGRLSPSQLIEVIKVISGEIQQTVDYLKEIAPQKIDHIPEVQKEEAKKRSAFAQLPKESRIKLQNILEGTLTKLTQELNTQEVKNDGNTKQEESGSGQIHIEDGDNRRK